MPPEDRAETERGFATIVDGGPSGGHDRGWIARDGACRLIAWSSVALPGPDGGPGHVVATGLDGTERRRAEQALRDTEERYRSVVHNLNEVVFQTDVALTAATNGIVIADATRPDLPVLYVNPGFERLTGYGQLAAVPLHDGDGDGEAEPGARDRPAQARRGAEAVEDPVALSVDWPTLRVDVLTDPARMQEHGRRGLHVHGLAPPHPRPGMARVLAVDDDPVLLKLVGVRLARGGHEVVTAGSAEEALAAAAAPGAPEVAVVDVAMPVMDGLELLQALRGCPGLAGLPAVFLSARVQPHDVEAGRALGAIYLTKPFRGERWSPRCGP
ncbi:MAG: response regulator [Actinomycetota bacterium]|nr:response regulator [Actinomycetota bacterium]